MKSILIDDLIKSEQAAPSASFTVEHEGKSYTGWGLAKPLNYDAEYLPEDVRKAMAQKFLPGEQLRFITLRMRLRLAKHLLSCWRFWKSRRGLRMRIPIPWKHLVRR